MNPKNLVLAAGASISALEPPTGEATCVVAVFTGLAALTVSVPVVGFLIAGTRLDDTLDGWRHA